MYSSNESWCVEWRKWGGGAHKFVTRGVRVNPLTPELNPSAQRFLPRFFTGILIFKGLTARRLYKSFGIKGFRREKPILRGHIPPPARCSQAAAPGRIYTYIKCDIRDSENRLEKIQRRLEWYKTIGHFARRPE
jgi:hypothetical protein